jgi:site-specific DNA-cytosine methylase
MKILVACEESQAVTIELRKLGHKAYSNDLVECSGGHPEWHLQQDTLELLEQKWDIIIAFPPCTYLTVTGNRWFNIERYGEKAIQRHKDREWAISFFKAIHNSSCKKIAIENPVGVMSTALRKPDQIIQPWQHGHTARKTTCLWLKGLPKITPTKIVDPILKYYKAKNGSTKSFSADYMDGVKRGKAGEASGARSKTYSGIAKAMAEQWAGNALKD